MSEKTTTDNVMPKLGDLIFVPDGTGLICAVYAAPNTAAWGDVLRPVRIPSCFVLPRSCVSREAGRHIGRRFETHDEAADVMGPLRTD